MNSQPGSSPSSGVRTDSSPSASSPSVSSPSGSTQQGGGIFITFEGGEGVGKSTQIRLLQARLEAAGYDVLCLREPGATKIGEQVRAILLDPVNTDLDPLAEMLLYEAARAQLVCRVIRPALARGTVVLCDRYSDSTLTYQGIARGLGIKRAKAANALGTDGLMPQRTILLVADALESLEKASEGGADRLEQAGAEFHLSVHEAFYELARREPERVRVVPLQEVKAATAELVFAAVADLFVQAQGLEFEVTDEVIKHVKQRRDQRHE